MLVVPRGDRRHLGVLDPRILGGVLMRPWWQFWHPGSGVLGGVVAGLIIAGLFFLPTLLGWV